MASILLTEPSPQSQRKFYTYDIWTEEWAFLDNLKTTTKNTDSRSLNVTSTYIMVLYQIACILYENVPPLLNCSELNYHLSCRSFTSATRLLQRWFKTASLSFRKLASEGRRLCTMASPVWFTATTLGWWLLMPSSSSYDRLHTINFLHLIKFSRYLTCTP